MDRQAPSLDQRGFPDFEAVGSRLDHEPGIYRRESGSAGSDRNVRLRGEVRHHDGSLLLAGRGAGHAVRGCFHDAVLLRQPRAQRSGVSEAALRRKDARLECHDIRGDDSILVRHQMYALGLLFELVLGWSFTASVLLSAAIVLVYTFLGGLTSAIYNEVVQFFPDRAGIRAARDSCGDEEPADGPASARTSGQVMTHTWEYCGQASRRIRWAWTCSAWSRG